MAEFTEREELTLQKLIRMEIQGAKKLPWEDVDYINDLGLIYNKFSKDHWEHYV